MRIVGHFTAPVWTLAFLAGMSLWVLAFGCAPAEGNDKMIVGAGYNKTCANWLRARQTRGDDLGFMEEWLSGFVSAANLRGGDKMADFNKDTEWPGVAAWVDDYCKGHPQDRLHVAVELLTVALIVRKANEIMQGK